MLETVRRQFFYSAWRTFQFPSAKPGYIVQQLPGERQVGRKLIYVTITCAKQPVTGRSSGVKYAALWTTVKD